MNIRCLGSFPRTTPAREANWLSGDFFMQKTPLIIVVITLLTVPFFGSAGPAPGCADLNPPGTWTNKLSGDCGFWMDDGLTFRIRQTWGGYWPDSPGQWDLIQLYYKSQISLSNAPGAPWYSASDTNVSFEIELPALWVKSRTLGDSTTTNSYLEMEVSAHADRFTFLATFVGTPAVTNVPESPEELPYILKSGPLSSARICLAYLPGDPGFPTNGRPRVSIRGRPLGPPQVELRWNSLSNGLYQVQSRPDFDSGDWTDLGSPLIGTGTNRSVVDTITPDAAQRFYRVLEFP